METSIAADGGLDLKRLKLECLTRESVICLPKIINWNRRRSVVSPSSSKLCQEVYSSEQYIGVSQEVLQSYSYKKRKACRRKSERSTRLNKGRLRLQEKMGELKEESGPTSSRSGSLENTLNDRKDIRERLMKITKRRKEYQKMKCSDATRQEEMTCSDCGKVCSSLMELYRHAVSNHSNRRPFKCKICGRSFALKSRTRHKLQHINGFVTDFQYGKDKASTTPIRISWAPTDHLCYFCGKKWSTAYELKKHKVIHTRASISQCELCQRVLKSPRVLRRHFQIVHMGVSYKVSGRKIQRMIAEPEGNLTTSLNLDADHFIQCNLCGKIFYFTWKLEEHRAKVHGIGQAEKPIPCEECGLWFKCKSYLMTHLQTKKHSKEKRFICEYCGKCLRKGLRSHIATFHPGIRLPRRFEYGTAESMLPELKSNNFISGEDPINFKAAFLETPQVVKIQHNDTMINSPESEDKIDSDSHTKDLRIEERTLATAQMDRDGDDQTVQLKEYFCLSPPHKSKEIFNNQEGHSGMIRRKSLIARLKRRSSAQILKSFSENNHKNSTDDSDAMPVAEDIKASSWIDGMEAEKGYKQPRTSMFCKAKSNSKPYQKPETRIKCRLSGCGFRALNLDELTSHRADIHGRNDPVRSYTFKCDEAGCGFRARFKESLDSHRLSHSSDAKETRAQKTNDKEKLKGHPYICTFPGCKKGFSHRVRLVAHIQNWHERSKRVSDKQILMSSTFGVVDPAGVYKVPMPCRVNGCKFRAKLRRELIAHRVGFHGSAYGKAFRPRAKVTNSWLNCDYGGCTYRALLPESLQAHYQRQHENRPTTAQFTCPECSKTFSSNAYRKVHMTLKHALGERINFRHSCKFCNKDFCSRHALLRHIQGSHEDAPTFPCSICTKRYYEEHETTIHEARHKKQIENPYKCVIQSCKEVYISLEDLRSHVSTSHDVGIGDRVICTVCGKFILAISLPSHAHRHRTPPKFKCSNCLKTFFNASARDRHSNSVHGETPRIRNRFNRQKIAETINGGALISENIIIAEDSVMNKGKAELNMLEGIQFGCTSMSELNSVFDYTSFGDEAQNEPICKNVQQGLQEYGHDSYYFSTHDSFENNSYCNSL